MGRLHRFHHAASEPFRANDALEPSRRHMTGVFSFLNPTRLRFHNTALAPTSLPKSPLPASAGSAHSGTSTDVEASSRVPVTTLAEDEQYASAIAFDWRSRDNRKGRHTLLVDPSASSNASFVAPKPTSSWRHVRRNLLRMVTCFPVWDISYLVAILFTLGSAVWVVNSFFAWLPLVRPDTEFPGEVVVGGGWTAWVGATIFELGSVFLLLEAVNADRAGCFGWALEDAVEDVGGRGHRVTRVRPRRTACRHHHSNRRNLLGPGATAASADGSADARASDDRRAWQWVPTIHDLRTHYLRSLGFLASAAQLLAASIFWISGFTALPAVVAQLTAAAALDGAFWFPQMLGGAGFVVSGALFMLETQTAWWRPAPRALGWWIGAWNVVGALGFTLCGALGPAAGADAGAAYQSALATFWGSWAFLVGSGLQWYESLEKWPVEEASLGERLEMRKGDARAGGAPNGVEVPKERVGG